MPSDLSPQNPRIELVRELRSAAVRRERGRFVIEGPTLLAEAGRSGIGLAEIYGTEKALREHAPLVQGLELGGTPAFTVPERTLARLSDLETPTGLLAVAVLPRDDLAALLARRGPVLLLAGISDPGNAGTVAMYPPSASRSRTTV